MSDCPYANPPDDMAELVEISDGFDRPLLLCPLKAARKRKLPRRIVLVCLRDTRRRIFLQRRADNQPHHPGLWDLSIIGDVLAGESFEGAVLRELAQRLGIVGARVRAAAFLPYTDSSGASLSAGFFVAGPTGEAPRLDPSTVGDGMFVDADELQGLVRHQQDMLTPELVWAVRSGWMNARVREGRG